MALRISRFARLMPSAAGRWIRIIAGGALIFWGWSMHSGTGMIVLVVGLVPIAAGVFDFCLIAPLLRAPLPPTSFPAHGSSDFVSAEPS